MIETLTSYAGGILTGAPIWVWGLLALLIFVGWRATLKREVSALRYAILPLWGALAITTVAQSSPTASVWFAFAAAYAIGSLYGWWAQGGIILGAGNGRALLRGEWLTMALLMTMFWLRFARAAIEAISPEVMSSPTAIMAFAFIAGTAAGVFMGRSARTLRAVYAPQARIS